MITQMTALLTRLLMSRAHTDDDANGPPASTTSPPVPRAGLTLPCAVTDVYDGDTITVTVAIPVRVRLLDCWAPEVRSRDRDEKRRGEAAREFVRSIAAGRTGRLHVPLGHVHRLDDAFTFGRLLAHVWLDGDDRTLSQRIREAGHATQTKQSDSG